MAAAAEESIAVSAAELVAAGAGENVAERGSHGAHCAFDDESQKDGPAADAVAPMLPAAACSGSGADVGEGERFGEAGSDERAGRAAAGGIGGVESADVTDGVADGVSPSGH